MTGAQISILSVYAVIVAIWPIRVLVIEIVLRRQRILSVNSPASSSRAHRWFQRSFQPRMKS